MSCLLDPFATEKLLIKSGNKSIADEYAMILKNSSEKKSIPKFYTSYRLNVDTITNFFASISTENALSNIYDRYPTQENVDALRDAFEKMVFSPEGLPVLGVKKQNRTMRYMQYQALRLQWPEELQPILSTKLFLEIGGSTPNTMYYDKFFDFLYFLVRASQHFVELRSYDPYRTGVISENAFMRYVASFAQEMAFVIKQQEVDPTFLKNYVDIVVNFVYISVDPLRTRIAPIKDITASPFLYFFMNLDPDDEDCQFDRNNIFSLTSSNFLLNEFASLDSNSDGILDPEDLMKLPNSKITKTFAESLINTAITNAPDFPWFIRFKAAWENLGLPWANAFFFEALDTNGDGIITEDEITIFIKDTKTYSSELLGEEITIDLSLGELFDMLQIRGASIPKDCFINSKETAILVKILGDCAYFILNFKGNDVLTTNVEL